jgi:iron complex transport system substrate-binding protein
MDPRRALQFGVTGGTVEEVLALNPDVVVAGSFMPPATRAALQRFGVRVETFGIAATVEDSIAQIRRLGAITGKEGPAETLAAAIADAVRPVRDPQPVSTVLWQPGGLVAGETALVTDMMRRAGLSSHSAARGLSQADYLSLERLLADPPDLLLVAGQERAQHHAALQAVSDMRVEGFDPALLYCGGPTIIRAMERLREIRAMNPREGGGAQP